MAHSGAASPGRSTVLGPLHRRGPLDWVGTAARLTLAVVFTWSGLAKLADTDQAVRAVQAYELVPRDLEEVVAYGLPLLEVALAILLVAGLTTRLAAVLSSALLVAFIAGIISAWARGLSIDCGCFGGGGEIESGQEQYLPEIIRDLALLAVAGWLVVRPASRFSIDPHPDDRHADTDDDDDDDDPVTSSPGAAGQPGAPEQQ